MTADVTDTKRALRAELRERRRTRTSKQVEEATEGFTRNLVAVAETYGARTIASYLSSPTEPNTRPFLNWAVAGGRRVLLPIGRTDGLLDWTEGDGESETEGLHGVPEAVGEILGPIAINDADLIVVPASAVDGRGIRMGWGRGYFDRTLGSMERCPPVFALVYDDEILDEVPREVHDAPVDGAVTPTRIVRFTH
ncbi:5-formyltetrahydrofolate cyclo-ligase [Humibacter sp. BT305]|uniref:5-formyltetrahydrofolate cyclo-ligase n=1 Tax=Cnuibacter physcomitrellae TaxID=1619308 RepID=UPI000E10516A|nr:5-formyltetrahydrofolate cyclo-ligase [Cnuibacter physcomitrellae]AXH36590.1 5-formyltetrahydrofolate cyclo-ligase [Humibacter sp. BT305]MCS5499436.1 5-formyltetrahydrofolate cyclo-ligase [Cnuibacter physcomitrellae]